MLIRPPRPQPSSTQNASAWQDANSADRGSQPYGQDDGPNVVGEALARARVNQSLTREIAQVVGTLATLLLARECVALHVTAATASVPMMAHEIAAAAGLLPACKTLLLSSELGASQLGLARDIQVPDVLASYCATGRIDVLAVATESGRFHMATFLPSGGLNVSATIQMQAAAVAEVAARLRRTYNLIVVDCRPVTEMAGFLPLTSGRPRTLLLIAAGRTRATEAVRARTLVERMGGELIGAVLTPGVA